MGVFWVPFCRDTAAVNVTKCIPHDPHMRLCVLFSARIIVEHPEDYATVERSSKVEGHGFTSSGTSGSS